MNENLMLNKPLGVKTERTILGTKDYSLVFCGSEEQPNLLSLVITSKNPSKGVEDFILNRILDSGKKLKITIETIDE